MTTDLNARIATLPAFDTDSAQVFAETTTDDLVEAGWADDDMWWSGRGLPARIYRLDDGLGAEVRGDDGIWHEMYPGYGPIPEPEIDTLDTFIALACRATTDGGQVRIDYEPELDPEGATGAVMVWVTDGWMSGFVAPDHAHSYRLESCEDAPGLVSIDDGGGNLRYLGLDEAQAWGEEILADWITDRDAWRAERDAVA